MMTFAAAGRVVIARSFDGDEILPLLREERPTKVWMLPSALYALTRDHHARHEDFSSVKACYSGGDKVSDALEADFTALAGIAIDEDYGMTEIGVPTVTLPASPKVGSVGPLAPGYQASLRDNDGCEVATGVDGRLWIKFPGNMVGYWNNPVATAETVVDGWLDTGDVMSADEDGYLWFHGRQKQIIIHDGSNICPQEVEAALLEHDAVSNAGVVGVQSLLHGENVRALCHAGRGYSATHDAGSHPIRLRPCRLQSAGGDHRPGRNAAQRNRQGRPCNAEKMGGRGATGTCRSRHTGRAMRPVNPEWPGMGSGLALTH
jgi:long-chain acyl-CoA synthetase